MVQVISVGFEMLQRIARLFVVFFDANIIQGWWFGTFFSIHWEE